MLTKFNTPFKFLGNYFEEYGKIGCDKAASSSSCSWEKGSNLMVIGLQIIVEISTEGKSNLIVMRKSNKSFPSMEMEACFLKSCFLCNKNLSLEKDIYMYRGDQGFCSLECRDRQIYLDEMKEVEASTKNIRRSYRDCSSSGRHETRRLLEDLRRRNNPVAVTNHQKHWAIVS